MTSLNSVVVGNCQSASLGNLLATIAPELHATAKEIHTFDQDMNALIDGFDLAFVQPHVRERITRTDIKLITVPRFTFSALHPDVTSVAKDGRRLISPVSHHSAIIFCAWFYGLSETQTAKLFTNDTFRALGFDRRFQASRNGLAAEWASCGLDLDEVWPGWLEQNQPFMLTHNHPRQHALVDLAHQVARLHGFAVAENYIPPQHPLEAFAIMPVYPDLAAAHGMTGDFRFVSNVVNGSSNSYDLEEFIARCFAMYERAGREGIDARCLSDTLYQQLFSSLAPSTGKHPYAGLPAHQNWRKAVEKTSPAKVDPVVACGFQIGPDDKVATAGSCFAQHIARALSASGLNYYAPETGDAALGYGLFSARYGNIYTPAQLNQLIDRAYGRFTPHDAAWEALNGDCVDPFRPEVPIMPATRAGVVADLECHLTKVREMIENMDYFVFTLGLTEAWRRRSDGAVFPIAPGVIAGSMNPAIYEFVNFDERETYDHLDQAITKIRAVNPDVKIILTVSPVPLKATYEPRHVLTSTTYSKAVLRVAAERACREFADTFYFPSLEIITGAFNRGTYFAEDLRSVRPEGVQHVMRLFLKHGTTANEEEARRMQEEHDVLCAEEFLDAPDEQRDVA